MRELNVNIYHDLTRFNTPFVVVCTAQFVNRNFCAWSKSESFLTMKEVLNFISESQKRVDDANQEEIEDNE